MQPAEITELEKSARRPRGEASLGDTIQQILDSCRVLLNLDLLTLLLFRKARRVTLSAPSGPEVGLIDRGWSKSMEPWLVSCDEEQTYQKFMICLETVGRDILLPLLADRKIVTISDLEQACSTPVKSTSPLDSCKSLIFIPLVMEGELFAGLLGAWVKQEHQFLPWETKVAELIGSQMAMVFRTARLQDSLQTQVDRLQALLEISTVIYSSLDYELVLEKIIQHAKNLAGADGCSIYLLDHEKQLLHPLITNYEEYQEQIMSFTLKLGQGVTGKVAQTGLGIISNYAETDTRTVQIPGTPEEPESIISVPLMWSGVVIGVITINAKGHKRFREEDLNLLTIFARLVADALENARLYKNLEKAYQELRETQEQLVRTERLRALGEMAGGVAHDFNNVLGSILGRAQLLLKVTQDGKVVKNLKVIEQSALDGAEVVRRIQDFTRVHKSSNFIPVDVNRIIEEALEQTKPMWKDQAQAQGIYIQVVKNLSSLDRVEGIPAELREVLANLIINSVDAMSQSGTITFSTSQDEAQVFVRVADTGRGMPEDVKKRIFDPFFTTKGKRGTGLGLSVVYGIISRHKGDIQVESEEGKGTVITMRFPKATAPEVHPPQLSAQKLERQLNILVVDDDENIRSILNDILALDGHQVVLAESGTKALEVFHPEKIDLVITDLGMPGMSGWEVAKKVKEKDSAKPVVLISGWGGQIEADKLKENKVDFMLSKPFNIEQIRGVLAQAVELQSPQPVE